MSEQTLTVHGICPAVTRSIAVVSAQGGLTLLLILHTRCGHYIFTVFLHILYQKLI